ncbi:hypothetical protein NDU88_004422 [Pleurodeles waltl]|uniref:Uncharacterized protein n=1 Tax=Pleurodeles waltl TaxID=8319 RepID=A0AAV7QC87_PLEWA|nr:hypothetical protein NDU88_004422 [Pleurodeles waltl]
MEGIVLAKGRAALAQHKIMLCVYKQCGGNLSRALPQAPGSPRSRSNLRVITRVIRERTHGGARLCSSRVCLCEGPRVSQCGGEEVCVLGPRADLSFTARRRLLMGNNQGLL